MNTDSKGSREDKKLQSATSPGPALLTRADAAALLRCSISSVRRLEGDALHPIVGPDGVHRFDPAEIARLASSRSPLPINGSKEGERDARVFEAFEQGKGLREIVTTLRLPADLVSKLHASWHKMGTNQDMILSSDRLAQLRSVLGFDVRRPADLVDEVRWLTEQCNALEVERNKLDNQLGDLMNAIATVAAQIPDIAKALAELSNHLDPDLARRFDTVLTYFTNERPRSSPPASLGATSTGITGDPGTTPQGLPARGSQRSPGAPNGAEHSDLDATGMNVEIRGAKM